MMFRLIQIIFLFVSCAGNGQNDVTGKYYTSTKESYITITTINDDSIIYGNHCFVSVNGERIDCCIDEELSIRIQKKAKTEYEGTLLSCYDDFEYAVLISFEKESLRLIFKEDNHPFMSKELKLYKEK